MRALGYAAAQGALTNLEKIDLYNNELTDAGAHTLAHAIGAEGFQAPKLIEVVTTRNQASCALPLEAASVAFRLPALRFDPVVGLTRDVCVVFDSPARESSSTASARGY